MNIRRFIFTCVKWLCVLIVLAGFIVLAQLSRHLRDSQPRLVRQHINLVVQSFKTTPCVKIKENTNLHILAISCHEHFTLVDFDDDAPTLLRDAHLELRWEAHSSPQKSFCRLRDRNGQKLGSVYLPRSCYAD